MSASNSLRPYQQDLKSKILAAFRAGHKTVLAQLPPGGGKTVVFVDIVLETLAKSPDNRVLILTDRTELRAQAQEKARAKGIRCSAIQAGEYFDPGARLHIGMEQTINARKDELKYQLRSYKLVIIDEAHKGGFRKLYTMFEGAYVIGFTATPVSRKKNRLDLYYQTIVQGPQVGDLIAEGFLCQYRHFTPVKTDIRLLEVKKSGDDFTDESQLVQLRTKKVYDGVKTALDGVGRHLKTVVFCVNIEHAQGTFALIRQTGRDVRLLTSKNSSKDYRRETLAWFARTPGAVLVNCGILTTGWDEPTIEHVVILRSVFSLSEYLQIIGRGSRPAPGKEEFIVSDFGGCIEIHGRWDIAREWSKLFVFEEKKPKAKTLTPDQKECPKCQRINRKNALVCACGYKFGAEQIVVEISCDEMQDTSASGLPKHLQISESKMSVSQLIERAAIGNLSTGKPYSQSWIVHQIMRRADSDDLLREFAELRGYKPGWVHEIKRAHAGRKRAQTS
jgi:superfamily II DNA or RNA helicase